MSGTKPFFLAAFDDRRASLKMLSDAELTEVVGASGGDGCCVSVDGSGTMCEECEGAPTLCGYSNWRCRASGGCAGDPGEMFDGC